MSTKVTTLDEILRTLDQIERLLRAGVNGLNADVSQAVVKWLGENARKCDHGYVHITCGDCCQLKVDR